MKITNGLVFTEEGLFERHDVFVENGVFAEKSGGEVINADGLLVIPGLVDTHFHGCAGHDFSDGTDEAVSAIVRYELECGVTTICPAVMALPETELECVFAAAGNCKSDVLAGVNMEAPFLSPEKSGAHDKRFLCAQDVALFDRLNALSGGKIKIVTVAPELENANGFINAASETSSVSLGHSAADYDCAVRAFACGANRVTHLFNAMSPFSHRAPGIIGAAADCGAYAELICDGVHVHPSAVRLAFSIFGDKIILISDSMRAAGLPDGTYALGGQDVTVAGGKAVVAGTDTIAGSVFTLADCLR